MSRTLLHAATDWPGQYPKLAATIALLVARGADIDAPGSVLGGGPPFADACGFKQWAVAVRLVERGATTTPWNVAALGLDDRVGEYLAAGALPEIADGAPLPFAQDDVAPR